MKSVGISWKINIGLCLSMLLCISLLLAVSVQVEQTSKSVTQTLAAELERQQITRDIKSAFYNQRQEWKLMLLLGHLPDDLDNHRTLFTEQQSRVAALAAQLQTADTSPEATRLVDRFSIATTELDEAYRNALAHFLADPIAHQRNAELTVSASATTALDHLAELVEYYTTQVDERIQNQLDVSTAESRDFLLAATGALVVMMLVFFLVLNYRVVVPLKQLVVAALKLTDDDIKVSVPNLKRGDEVGELARALETFRRNRISGLALQRSAQLAITEREQVKQAALEAELELERAAFHDREQAHAMELVEEGGKSEKQLRSRIGRLSQAVHAAAQGDLKYLAAHPESDVSPDDDLRSMTADLESLFGQFDRDFARITHDADTLNQSATHLSELGQSINDGAKLNTEQTQQVLEAAQTVKVAMSQVAENIQEMDSGIRGIAGSAQQASGVAAHAVELARNTDTTMRQLSESSTDIGNVIKLITSVAEQTNLLALNATIEAARAGDAGKGFAVVANEVKELAKETNRATDEIERRISAIRSDTDKAVDAIGNINSIVSEIDDIQASISQAVQVQSDAAQVITELVSTTAGGNTTVRELIVDVAERQQATQHSAAEIQRASDQLRHSAEGSIELTARYA